MAEEPKKYPDGGAGSGTGDTSPTPGPSDPKEANKVINRNLRRIANKDKDGLRGPFWDQYRRGR